MCLYGLNEFTKRNKPIGKGDDVVSRHDLDMSEYDRQQNRQHQENVNVHL